MEKLRSFDKSTDLPKSMWIRFQCDCLHAADAMDIKIEDYDSKFITVTMNFVGTSFWDRVKYAFQILRGRWSWREFIPRQEDYQSLSDIFSLDKSYSDLEDLWKK